MNRKTGIGIFLLTLASVITFNFDAKAVSREEMETAKTITAKLYLRYANNGSGYLDDVVATSMKELTAKLKKKELENLEAFNAVPVPAESEYAGWDKAQLRQFWSITFLDNPKLLSDGKLARKRIDSQIRAMDIKEVDSPASQPEGEAEQPAEAQAADVNPEVTLQALEDSVSAISTDTKELETESKSESSDGSTTIYVIILCILLAAVVALVIYASRILKRRPEDPDDRITDANVSQKLFEKDSEITALKARIEEMQTAANEYKEHIIYLKEQLKKANAKLEERATMTAHETITPVSLQAATPKPAHKSRVIYLSRANKNGIFLGAQREPDHKTSLFKLVTTDSVTGTFTIIDEAATDDLIFSDPEEALTYSCICKDMNTEDKDQVITERGGTAIFEDGRWRVLRKAIVRFE